MLPKEKISIESFDDKKFKIKLIESEKDTEAAFTHYLHNYKNGVSQFYKPDALEHVKTLFKYKFPEETITNIAAEEALQYLIFQQENIPFPAPKKPKFKFIDLFAGIGDFRKYLGVTLKGRAIRANLFARASQKGFLLLSLTQKAS